MKYGWCGSLLPTRVRAAVLKHTKRCTEQHSSPWIGLILALLLRCLISAGLLHWSHRNLDCTTSAPKTVVLTMVAPPPNHVTTPAGHTIAVNQRNMQYKTNTRLNFSGWIGNVDAHTKFKSSRYCLTTILLFRCWTSPSYIHSRCLLRCRTSQCHTQHSVSKIKKMRGGSGRQLACCGTPPSSVGTINSWVCCLVKRFHFISHPYLKRWQLAGSESKHVAKRQLRCLFLRAAEARSILPCRVS